MQAYNAPIAVDAESQVIVAAHEVQAPNDVRQLVPMAQAIVANVRSEGRALTPIARSR